MNPDTDGLYLLEAALIKARAERDRAIAAVKVLREALSRFRSAHEALDATAEFGDKDGAS